MRKLTQKIVQMLITAALVLAALAGLNRILVLKDTYRNSEFPVTSSLNQFFQLEPDSIDVLFFGSSYAETSFIPQELYDTYGITSYNLGTYEQSMFMSYYLLKQALVTQHPEVVFLECRFAFPIHYESSINMSFSLARQTINCLPEGEVKKEAVRDFCARDPEGSSPWSFFWTNLIYHERWSELTEVDYDQTGYTQAPLFGYAPVFDNGIESYEPFVPADSEAAEPLDPTMQEYMDKFIALCQEANIAVVLVSVPSSNMSDEKNNTLQAYAQEKGVVYLNLSEASVYEQIGCSFPSEQCVDHENILGAVRTTDYVGKWLQQEYELEPREEELYEEQEDFYQQMLRNGKLPFCAGSDWQAEYLQLLSQGSYTVLMVVRENVGTLAPQTQQALSDLGIVTDFSGQYYKSWYGVWSNGEVVTENLSADSIQASGLTGDGLSQWTVVSENRSAGTDTRIIIDGEIYNALTPGIQIVVYDNLLGRVIHTTVLNEDLEGAEEMVPIS